MENQEYIGISGVPARPQYWNTKTIIIFGLLLCSLIFFIIACVFSIVGGIVGIGEVTYLTSYCGSLNKETCLKTCGCGWCHTNELCIEENIETCNGTMHIGPIDRCDDRNNIITIFKIIFYIAISIVGIYLVIYIIGIIIIFHKQILKCLHLKKQEYAVIGDSQ